MDPVSVLGVASSLVAIFDGLKEAYRFGRDVIQADSERKEFKSKLDYVYSVVESLKDLIEREHPGQAEVILMGLKDNQNSPLEGLRLALEKMVETLRLKTNVWKQKMKNFKWHSEKQTLEQYFVELNGYVGGIQLIVQTASMSIETDTYIMTQEIDFTTQHTNLLTRELVLQVKENNEVTRRIQEDIKRGQTAEEERRTEKEKKEIESWLSPLDFQAQQREKLEGTAPVWKHFIDSPEFRNWQSGQVDYLKCHGPTGAGKTILSAIVSNHLQQVLPKTTPVLCIFFEQKPSFPHNTVNILGSLLKQLIQLRDSGIPSMVRDAYAKAKKINAKPTPNEIKDLLKAELQNLDTLFIVVDALDEASEDSQILVERDIRRLCPDNLKLMTTRREDVELSHDSIVCSVCRTDVDLWYHCSECPQTNQDRTDLCQNCRDIHRGCPKDATHSLSVTEVVVKAISTTTADLETFVRGYIQNQMPEDQSDYELALPRGSASKLGWECHRNDSLFTGIVEAVVKASKGRFLLAKQYTRSLSSKQTLGAIKKAVRELAADKYSLSERIDQMYDDDMEIRIKGQEYEKATYALRILAVVSTARRNLKLVELQHALATFEDTTAKEFDPDDQLERQDILDRTKGLIRIDRDKDAVVRLDHRTLEDYFKKTHSKHFPTSERDMAKACLQYLNYDTFSRPCERIEEFAEKEKSHPLISYAVQYWGDHVQASNDAGIDNLDVTQAAVTYLQTPLRLEAYIQAGWASHTFEHDKWDVRRTIHPLHVCAWFNLHFLISALDYQDMDLNVRENTYGQTPLMYACRRGNEQVVRRLLELGASVNLISGRGRTALFEAVLGRHKNIVEILLSPEFEVLNVNANIPNEKMNRRTPLMVASHRDQLDIVVELLKYGHIAVNLQDLEGNTALTLASYEGHSDVVSALLQVEDIKLDTKDNGFGRTPLSSAAEENHAEIVELLLSRGADATIKDVKGGYAALRAAEEGSLKAVQVLLDHKIEITSPDEDGCTPLHLASANGHVEIIRVIIEQYNDIDVRDNNGMTPFHKACSTGNIEAGRFLISMGANPSAKDNFQRSSLVIAWQYGQQELVDLCRGKETDNDSGDLTIMSDDELPLWSLVLRRDINSVAAALSSGIDATVKEQGTENTVLHVALSGTGYQHLDDEVAANLLKIILPVTGHLVDNFDNCGRSPLHLAALYGHIECVKILLEVEPQLSEVDRFGLTPLAIAYKNNYFPIAAMLIEAGSDIPLARIDTQKMLFKAIELQNPRAVEFLVSAGADATTPDEFGRTVTHLAMMSGETRLMHLVKSIKSSMWQTKNSGTTNSVIFTEKADISTKAITRVEVVEISNDIAADRLPSVSHLPQPMMATGAMEEAAICV